jgi:hypothetical protein
MSFLRTTRLELAKTPATSERPLTLSPKYSVDPRLAKQRQIDDDDKDQSLLQLSLRHDASIISHLVDIGSERNQQEHVKFRYFISSLQCLQPKGTKLQRRSINAFHQQRYIALSYAWDPSGHEDKEPGQHTVENWDDDCLQPSPVRKCVLDRAIHYMRYTDVRFLWIDAHCIRQDTCDIGNCARHSRCIQKRDAIQAMDLVYQLSEHPVALLGRTITSGYELHLLTRILSGNLIDGHGDGEFRLSAAAVYEARKALSLLYKMTRDKWWGRAWTFQENYRGGPRMRLLIRHNPLLERQKLRYRRLFGELPGELCVLSVDFSTEATRLCLALRAIACLHLLDIQRIDGVLKAAGRYRLMLHESSRMTPIVIADLEARKLSKPWDRLAITANCCQYAIRLDGEALSQQRCSLSLSVLAMCLLNGEILDNGNEEITSAADLTTSGFLETLMFRAFYAPEGNTRRLTFNKGCRLTDVELTAGGIATRGHVWKLGRVIDTSRFGRKLPWIDEPSGRLTLGQRKRLLQLVFHLNDLNYRWLADRIDDYLAADANAIEDYASFTDMYLHHMAAELAAGIQARQKLRLGSIWDPTGQSAPYRAVFVWSGEGDEGIYLPPPAFVFTSARQGDRGSRIHDANDINHHVSLKVELEEPLGSSSSIPRLCVHGWLLGMCFFDECPRIRVVFPWPRALRVVEP